MTNDQLINGDNDHLLQLCSKTIKKNKEKAFQSRKQGKKLVKGSLCLMQRPQRLTRTRQTHSTSEVSQPGHPITQKCASTEFTHQVKSEEFCTKVNQHGDTQRDCTGLRKSYIHISTVFTWLVLERRSY